MQLHRYFYLYVKILLNWHRIYIIDSLICLNRNILQQFFLYYRCIDIYKLLGSKMGNNGTGRLYLRQIGSAVPNYCNWICATWTRLVHFESTQSFIVQFNSTIHLDLYFILKSLIFRKGRVLQLWRYRNRYN